MDSTTIGTTIVRGICPAGQFLLNYGYRAYDGTDGVTLDFTRYEDLIFATDNKTPIGVEVFTSSELEATGRYDSWTLFVDTVCCPI
jgi:hypothetical protein